MSECKDCRFYCPQHSKADRGECMNFSNAESKWVGGGGEYSSSAKCYCPPNVHETQGCDLFEAGYFVPPKIRRQPW